MDKVNKPVKKLLKHKVIHVHPTPPMIVHATP
ncbi:hypothetical protein AI2585V1_5466 (plasmid) [Klebsiella pneumoniae]|uniref:Uncharacterized protein n=1 Tax=Klebsiella pneumoniae TaxID=573 RepID=A0A486RY73_KLEPN|nr:hypothetical protein AI2585V1_5466 [Klebsiella pneumoniae]CAF9498644.1 hypothetical protein AI2921V1_5376 [Klebsiella pneumoniae]CAH3524209.1 hypothetical protein AI2585V1_5466 [Klebsiella pneumoniae]CAH6286486.1 hypothetical protein AI2921V1_5376 [Klebsiella pneumoniae]SAV27650.1 Uncharacterised protein [Klebsiella pneumoniae]